MKKKLFPILALVLAIGMMPAAFVSATNGTIPPEVSGTVFAYIPNSSEASVSKVDVVDNAEVARYSTIPHRSAPDYLPIRFYRPVRLAIDSGGNAWALNTMSYEPDLAANPDAQGSVARISSTPVGADITSTAGGLAGIVEDDDRVSFFDVGGPGDAPRSISIVEEAGEVYLWIGFYVGHYFQKYHYDTSGLNPVLVAVSGEYIDVSDDVDYTPYYTIIDDGYMWVSSRDSGYPTAGENGILLININTLDWIVVPYDITATTGRDIPYALRIASDGRCWVSDSGEPWPRYRTFVVYTRDGLSITATEEVPVGIAEYPSMCGFTELDGDIWATEFGGNVLKGTYNGSWTFTSMLNLGSGLTWLTGISKDPFGDLWVVSFDHDKLYKIDPEAPGTPIAEVTVGDGPYAYALAIEYEETPSIEVEKHYSYTDVDFEEIDDDGDGLFGEDPIDGEDNDGDLLIDEDPMDTYLGTPLPMDAEDNYVLEAVVHEKSGKVRSYNPGQYYAVSTVTVLSDVDTLTIFEDWSACAEISTLNPRNGGGRVVIVQVGSDGVVKQILDADSNEVTVDNANHTAIAVLQNVSAGTTILMYVKFGPGLKGETWDPPPNENEHYGPCINYNMASTLADPGDPDPLEPGDWIIDDAMLIVVAKD